MKKETIHNYKLNSSNMKFPHSPNKMEIANNQRISRISKCCLWFQKVVKSMISSNFAIFEISKMVKNENEAKLAKIVHTNSPLEPKTSKTAKSLIIRTFFRIFRGQLVWGHQDFNMKMMPNHSNCSVRTNLFRSRIIVLKNIFFWNKFIEKQSILHLSKSGRPTPKTREVLSFFRWTSENWYFEFTWDYTVVFTVFGVRVGKKVVKSLTLEACKIKTKKKQEKSCIEPLRLVP